MDFALKAALSFLVGGGGYVSGVVWLSERLGSRIGGVVAGLPSTILVGLAFITLTEGPGAARSAVAVVPLMFTATLLYAVVFLRSVSRSQRVRKHPIAILAASVAWLVAAAVIRPLSDAPFFLIVLAGLAGLGAFHYALRHLEAPAPRKIRCPGTFIRCASL